jgi:hypothetical protein
MTAQTSRPGSALDRRPLGARPAPQAAGAPPRLHHHHRVVLMARLIYSAIASADGYVEDADGSFEWAAPDEELHRFVNELERPVGTYL